MMALLGLAPPAGESTNFLKFLVAYCTKDVAVQLQDVSECWHTAPM
jgi:hypothetical protein